MTSPGEDTPQLELILSNCPPEQASELARALVLERLATCVNVIPGVTSFYWWEGEVVEDAESTLLIKTTRARRAALVARLLELHPYEVPEVVTVAPRDVLERYDEWAIASTTSA